MQCYLETILIFYIVKMITLNHQKYPICYQLILEDYLIILEDYLEAKGLINHFFDVDASGTHPTGYNVVSRAYSHNS